MNDLDNYDGQMVSRDKCSLNFLISVSQLRENPEEKKKKKKWRIIWSFDVILSVYYNRDNCSYIGWVFLHLRWEGLGWVRLGWVSCGLVLSKINFFVFSFSCFPPIFSFSVHWETPKNSFFFKVKFNMASKWTITKIHVEKWFPVVFKHFTQGNY